MDPWLLRLHNANASDHVCICSLTRDKRCYILDTADVMGEDYPSETFRVLNNKELKAFGEYRTQKLVLAAWDALAKAGL